ncbi:MAG TPA: hypothetical protein VHO25_08015, partial [Polyangiaceae bacterium]|nr:hypothetical protein [Polyangiaceae bacterium]
LPDVREAYPDLKKQFAKRGIELRLLSSATHEGLDGVIKKIAEVLDQAGTQLATEPDDAITPPKPRKLPKKRTVKTKPVGKKPVAVKGKPVRKGKPVKAKRRAKRR